MVQYPDDSMAYSGFTDAQSRAISNKKAAARLAAEVRGIQPECHQQLSRKAMETVCQSSSLRVSAPLPEVVRQLVQTPEVRHTVLPALFILQGSKT